MQMPSMSQSENVGAHSGIGDESNALEPARVGEAHHIQILNLPTEAPILTNGIYLRSTAKLLEPDQYGKPICGPAQTFMLLASECN